MTKKIAEDYDDMIGTQEESISLHKFLGLPNNPETEEAAWNEYAPHELARREWVGMPEFHAENKQPPQQILMSFRTHDDALKFGELLHQKITPKTKALWYPEKIMNVNSLKRWFEDDLE